MADPSTSSSDRTAGKPLDRATRERVLSLLQDELARASRDALERGESSAALVATLDERIAKLRAEINAMSADEPAPQD